MRALLLLASSVALASPRPARACSCAMPRVVISPGPGVVAPLNVQIRITWSEGTDAAVDEASLAVVAKSGTPVAVDARAFTSGSVRTVLITPRKPLAAKTTYQIAAKSKAGDPEMLGEITTGTAADDKAPTWKGIGKTRAAIRPAVCCACGTGKAYAALEVLDAKDDRAPGDAIAFAIWPAKGKLDASSLLAIVSPWSGWITLGHASTCSTNNFAVPAKGTIRHVRIAPIDLAGNAGDPVDVTIDVSDPEPER